MSYSSQAALSRDSDFINRVGAAAAKEFLAELAPDPIGWANTNIWWVAAAPGFDLAYESAQVAGNPQPGNDPAVISDGQILSAIQAVIASQTPPPA